MFFKYWPKRFFFYNGQLPLKPLANRLLPSWQVVKCPLHSKFSIQVLSLEPRSTNPYWQEKRTVFPTLKSPNRSPLSGLPGSGHSFSAKRICESMLRIKQRPKHKLQIVYGMHRESRYTQYWNLKYTELNIQIYLKILQYHPTLKLSGIPTFTCIVSLTHRMDNI